MEWFFLSNLVPLEIMIWTGLQASSLVYEIVCAEEWHIMDLHGSLVYTDIVNLFLNYHFL